MFQALTSFFNSENFMPHGHCFLWQPNILWLQVISDAGVAAAYFAIPFALFYFTRKRKDLPFPAIFWLFGAFILLCGTSHVMSIWVLWHPDYAIEGIIKALTAIASIATFFVIVKLIPQALHLASPAQLAALNKELQDANRKLEILYEQSQESSQARIRSMIDNALDAVIAMDQEGNITEWNRQAEAIFGWSHKDAIGKKLAETIIPPEQRNAHHTGMQKFLEDGTGPMMNKRIEVTAMNRKGMRFPLELAVTAQKIKDKYHFTAFACDISERKENEKKIEVTHKFIEDMMNHIPDPIFMKDREHRWIGGNKAFWEMMNGPAEKFLGKSDYEFFPKAEADVFWEKDDRVLNSGEVDINEEFFTDARGRKHVLSTKKVAFLNEKGERFLVGVIRDITDVKESEAKLLRYMQELERSNQELDDFAYIASHDLKEPLRGLFNHASFLQEDYKDKLDKEGVHRLQRLSHLCQRMEQLVNDLLYFSRLGRTELAIQETDPNTVVIEIQQMIEPFLKERNAHIAIPKPMPTIVCDKPRVTEVFRNLITNAAKYNDKKERIVEVGFLERAVAPHGKEINVFYVKDNGVGIAPEFHEDIFRMFKRLPNPVGEKETGTGAGLTFVKKIIERHKGHVWLESELDKGTTFYFTLK